MAQFKVGDKVRVIANHCPEDYYGKWGDKLIGNEGVIVGTDWHPKHGDYWRVRVPAVRIHPIRNDEYAPDEWGCLSSELAPILDDSQWADEKLSQLKRDVMKPIEISPKQMEEVRG